MNNLSDVFTALSHPARLSIIDTLIHSGPSRFTDVAKPFDVNLNAVTKHVKLLERAKLITKEKQGREVMISIKPEQFRRVANWVHEYERFWNRRLDQFQKHFAERRSKEKRK